MNTASKPTLTLSDLLREHRLTGRNFLVVEGDTDRRFIQEWLEGEAVDAKISVTPVDRVRVPDHELSSRSLSRGNRDRVICLALMCPMPSSHIRFLADRDAYDSSELVVHPTLFWTDYPAIESYTLNDKTFAFMNRMLLKEALPSTREVFDRIHPVLVQFHEVRRAHKTLHKPNYRAGVPDDGDFTKFDIWKTVNVEPIALPEVDSLSSGVDIRKTAYGHDIAPVLLAAYLQPLEKKARVHGVADLEANLMAALAAVRVVSSENLFERIHAWALK